MKNCTILWDFVGLLWMWFAASLPSIFSTTAASVELRRTAILPGDISVAVILPVHYSRQSENEEWESCRSVTVQGILTTEMFFYTLELLNSDQFILPGVALGGTLTDSCSAEPTFGALESFEDIITSTGIQPTTNNSEVGSVAAVLGFTSINQTSSIKMALQQYHIPQISIFSENSILNNKSMFPDLIGIKPEVSLQAASIRDILLMYNWTYVSLVTVHGPYWYELQENLERFLRDSKICIASLQRLLISAPEQDYDRVIADLLTYNKARVVVCLCEEHMIRGLLLAIHRQQAQGHFLIIAPNGWIARPDVLRGVEEAAVGGISVVNEMSPILESFHKYFSSLRPETNLRNPWFPEYWEQKFSCHLQLSGRERNSVFNKTCTGEETLAQVNLGWPDLLDIYTSVYTVAQSIDAASSEVCEGRRHRCDVTQRVSKDQLLTYLRQFAGERGVSGRRYNILNYQHTRADSGRIQYRHVKVGTWTNQRLEVEQSLMQWPAGNRGNSEAGPDPLKADVPRSVCSDPCPPDNVKVLSYGVLCCWVCVRCRDGEIALDEFTCADDHVVRKGQDKDFELSRVCY